MFFGCFRVDMLHVRRVRIKSNDNVIVLGDKTEACLFSVVGQLPLYLLTDLLHTEAQLVSVAVQLVYRGDLERRQRAGTIIVQQRLAALWREYEAGSRTATSLLSAGSHLICPRAVI